MSSLSSQIEDLVRANHILAIRQLLDGFGHVSVRQSDDQTKFLLARSMAPALVASGDILIYDSSGFPMAANPPKAYVERFIHSELYRSRPDVQAIVHSHAPAVIPFSVVEGVSLRPVYHMAAFLTEEIPVFEIRDLVGDGSDLLIQTTYLGVGLARCLGLSTAVLMRGHGVTVVGSSLKEAVFRAVYLQFNAIIQTTALQLGQVRYLSTGEARAAAVANESQMDRAWELWQRELTSA